MHAVYLALGSNLGDRLQHLRGAIGRIAEVVEIDRISRVYESRAIGFTDQPDFLNLVLRGRTRLEPAALLAQLEVIEVELGRIRTYRNAPRTIDIDIIAYDDLVLSTPGLTVPHPRMLERSFVLKPLLEIDPHFTHPSTGLGAAELAAAAATLPPAEPRFSV